MGKFFGIFILFIFISVSSSRTAQAVNVPLNMSLLDVYTGQTFDVNVTVDPLGKAIAGAQMNLEFNKSVLNINIIKEGDFFKQNGATTLFNKGAINNSNGTVLNDYDLILGKTNVTTKGTFIIINAKAIDSSNITWINVSNVKIVDPSGNYMALNIPTPTPTPGLQTIAGSGGGGGGGGGSGGGGTSGENFTNIETKEKYDLFINKGITTFYLFKKTGPIISVNITGNNNAGEINVAVEVLRDTSSLVKDPAPETVYKNINIWVGSYGFATPANIKHAEITFRIQKSWIESNGIDPDSITMMHYNGAWGSLLTQKKTETASEIYYEASTTSFSPFAIIGKKSNDASAMSEPKQIEKSVNTDGNQKSPPENSGNLNNTLIFGVFVGIVLILALFYRTRKGYI